MTDTTTVPVAGTTPADRHAPALWRTAGVLVIAHPVLMMAGFTLERSPVLGSSLPDARHALAEGSVAQTMIGGYVEALAFVLLVPALVLVARLVGRRTEVGRSAAQTSLAAGLCYVAVTLATGLPAGAAAIYEAHRGVDLRSALMMADARVYAFFLSLLVLSVQAIGLAVAARSDGFAPRWVGIGGLVSGALLAIGVAGGGLGLHDFASMLWVVWIVGVGVCLIRNAHAPAGDARR
jgi:hypothetical protein